MRLARIFKKAAAPLLLALSLMGCSASRHWEKSINAAKDFNIHSLPATPLPHAYAHNDYNHALPLFDALSNGFAAVEADIFLSHGQLLVAHRRWDTAPERTLEDMYLKPLAKIAAQNGNHIFAKSDQSLLLMIDIKSRGNETYQALHSLLQKYEHILTSYHGDSVHISAVTVMISGNRPDKSITQAQKIRYAGYDGRARHLGAEDMPILLMPMISENWTNHFDWRGTGPMPSDDRVKLRNLIDKAHARGQRIRFWNTPDEEPAARQAVWTELMAAGVDYINTDNLPALKDWLQTRPASPKP